jgi:hypothetical protein
MSGNSDAIRIRVQEDDAAGPMTPVTWSDGLFGRRVKGGGEVL